MRAAFFTKEFPPHIYGGAGVHVDYLSRELAKKIEADINKHDIKIINNFMRITAPTGTGYDTDILDSEGSYNVLVEGNYLELAVTGDENCDDCHDDVTQVWAASGDAATCPGFSFSTWGSRLDRFWTIQRTDPVQRERRGGDAGDRRTRSRGGGWDPGGGVDPAVSSGLRRREREEPVQRGEVIGGDGERSVSLENPLWSGQAGY